MTIPMHEAGGLMIILVLMIMSGMDWGGAHSHMREADNKVTNVKVTPTKEDKILPQFTLEAKREYIRLIHKVQ